MTRRVVETEMSFSAKYSSLAPAEFVKMAISRAATEENFIKMKLFPFQCMDTYAITEITTTIRNSKAHTEAQTMTEMERANIKLYMINIIYEMTVLW